MSREESRTARRAPGARVVADAMRRLPLHAISRAAGRAATVRWPRPVLRAGIRAFAALVGADLSEAEGTVASFATFQDFFTRALRAGARPVDPDPRAFVSPCDGAWGASGAVRDGALLQVKGRAYRVADLLDDEASAARLEGGAFATFYLAPRDYHRFHMPCDAEVVSARYVPGALWPVNRLGLEGVDGLFARNERICAWMRVSGSDPPNLCLVAVGATLVGSVRVVFDDLVTNVPNASATTRRYEPPVPLARGAEWGRFEFGSTIVLLAAPGVVTLEAAPPGSLLRLGRRIGTVPAAGG